MSAVPGKNWAPGVWAPGVWRPGVWAQPPGGTSPVFSGTIPNQDLKDAVAMSALNAAPYFNNSPTSYAVIGTLPTGLSFATDTGILTGTPTLVGAFAIRISATNGDGTGQSNLFTIYVADVAVYDLPVSGRKRDQRRRGLLRCGFGRG